MVKKGKVSAGARSTRMAVTANDTNGKPRAARGFSSATVFIPCGDLPALILKSAGDPAPTHKQLADSVEWFCNLLEAHTVALEDGRIIHDQLSAARLDQAADTVASLFVAALGANHESNGEGDLELRTALHAVAPLVAETARQHQEDLCRFKRGEIIPREEVASLHAGLRMLRIRESASGKEGDTAAERCGPFQIKQIGEVFGCPKRARDVRRVMKRIGGGLETDANGKHWVLLDGMDSRYQGKFRNLQNQVRS